MTLVSTRHLTQKHGRSWPPAPQIYNYVNLIRRGTPRENSNPTPRNSAGPDRPVLVVHAGTNSRYTVMMIRTRISISQNTGWRVSLIFGLGFKDDSAKTKIVRTLPGSFPPTRVRLLSISLGNGRPQSFFSRIHRNLFRSRIMTSGYEFVHIYKSRMDYTIPITISWRDNPCNFIVWLFRAPDQTFLATP